MSVLVIRPQEEGRKLCEQLEKAGVSTLLHPVIDLVGIEDGDATDPSLFPPLSENPPFDRVIAVSQHAVRFSNQWLHKHRQCWPTNVRYLAIGQKTARLLSKVTRQPVNYPEVSDSEHLLQEPLLTSVSGLNILILRGNGGRELLAKQLKFRGANVIYREVYQRVLRPFDAESRVALWQDRQIDRLIITSLEQLEFLVSQLPAHYHGWLFTLILYVPSERIARSAQSMGFRTTITVGSASNLDLVAALQPTNDRNTQ